MAVVSDADSMRAAANNPGALSKEAMFILTAATVCVSSMLAILEALKAKTRLNTGRVYQAPRGSWSSREQSGAEGYD